MIDLTERRDIQQPISDVFAYVADFATIEQWDPGVRSSRRLDDGPLGEGSRFAVVSVLAGREIDLEYVITAWEPSDRVVLETATKRFTGVDTITFEPLPDGGTRVVYNAVFRFQGPLRVMGFVMRPAFVRLVRDALDGLAKHYAG